MAAPVRRGARQVARASSLRLIGLSPSLLLACLALASLSLLPEEKKRRERERLLLPMLRTQQKTLQEKRKKPFLLPPFQQSPHPGGKSCREGFFCSLSLSFLPSIRLRLPPLARMELRMQLEKEQGLYILQRLHLLFPVEGVLFCFSKERFW